MKIRDDRFLIITGLSGSGKSAASRFLEDLGYFCVDNLPSKLIPLFVNLWRRREVGLERVALVVDIREPAFLEAFPRVWEEIRKKAAPRLIFLDASNEALVHRFSESRRPHPLIRHRSVLEGVRLERKRLVPIKALADEVIDTSGMTIAQLRDVFARRFRKARRPPLRIQVTSFGYKHGIPLDSDLVFDARLLPNPFYVDALRTRNGKSPSVRKFVLESPGTRGFLRELFRFVDFVVPRFAEEGKTTVAIAVGCTGGKHRSVVIAEELRAHLKNGACDVRIYHRDLFK